MNKRITKKVLKAKINTFEDFPIVIRGGRVVWGEGYPSGIGYAPYDDDDHGVEAPWWAEYTWDIVYVLFPSKKGEKVQTNYLCNGHAVAKADIEEWRRLDQEPWFL